jgi:hypothetical protein
VTDAVVENDEPLGAVWKDVGGTVENSVSPVGDNPVTDVKPVKPVGESPVTTLVVAEPETTPVRLLDTKPVGTDRPVGATELIEDNPVGAILLLKTFVGDIPIVATELKILVGDIPLEVTELKTFVGDIPVGTDDIITLDPDIPVGIWLLDNPVGTELLRPVGDIPVGLTESGEIPAVRDDDPDETTAVGETMEVV